MAMAITNANARKLSNTLRMTVSFEE